MTRSVVTCPALPLFSSPSRKKRKLSSFQSQKHGNAINTLPVFLAAKPALWCRELRVLINQFDYHEPESVGCSADRNNTFSLPRLDVSGCSKRSKPGSDTRDKVAATQREDMSKLVPVSASPNTLQHPSFLLSSTISLHPSPVWRFHFISDNNNVKVLL